MSHHHSHMAHDLECVSGACAFLIERAEGRGNRKAAKELRREWREYWKLRLTHMDAERLSK